MRNRRFVFAAIFAVAVTWGGSLRADAPPTKDPPSPVPKWTFVVFMESSGVDGSANMNPSAFENITSIMGGIAGTSANIIVQLSSVNPDKFGSEGKAHRFLVKKDSLEHVSVAPLPKDYADALYEGAYWAFKEYPAQCHGIIVATNWFRPSFTIRKDEAMTPFPVSRLASAVERITLTAPKDPAGDKKIDLFGFDCPLMGNFEVAVALSKYVNFFVGNEDRPIVAAWPYKEIFKMLSQHGPDANVVAKKIVRFCEQMDKSEAPEGCAAVNLNKIGTVLEKFLEFTKESSENEIVKAWKEKFCTEHLQLNDREIVDIVKFCKAVYEASFGSTPVQLLTAFENALDQAIIAITNTQPGNPTPPPIWSGLSVHPPAESHVLDAIINGPQK
ncbi:hypothetical protein HOD08_03170 [bacterium]|nr:hypothetical protein [bacterium]